MGMTAARLRERRAIERKNAPPPAPPLTEAQRFANAHAELARLRILLVERDALIGELQQQNGELQQQLEQLTQPQQSQQEQQPQPARGSEKRRGRP